MNDECLIWSNQHRAWWAPACGGYVLDVACAGRFTETVARNLVTEAQVGRRVSSGGEFLEPPPELICRLADVVACGIA